MGKDIRSGLPGSLVRSYGGTAAGARAGVAGRAGSSVQADGVEEVFHRRYCLHLPEPLNIPAMRQAAEALIGEHDFRSFTSLKSKKKSTVRILYALELAEKEGWVELFFEGSGFLHNMIRIITGTLLEVGLGRIEPAAMKHILEKGERSAAGPLAPPQGLCLLEVLF